MRRRAFFLLIAFLILSAAGPAARAESGDPLSPGRGSRQADIPPDNSPLEELPTAEISMEILSNSGGGAIMAVDAEQMMRAVEAVAGGDAVSVTIAAKGADGAASVSAEIPREALAAVAERTEAEVSVVSELGQVVLSNAAVTSILEQSGDDITVTMARTAGGGPGGAGVTVDILSGGARVSGWDGESTVLASSAVHPTVLSPLAARTKNILPKLFEYELLK